MCGPEAEFVIGTDTRQWPRILEQPANIDIRGTSEFLLDDSSTAELDADDVERRVRIQAHINDTLDRYGIAHERYKAFTSAGHARIDQALDAVERLIRAHVDLEEMVINHGHTISEPPDALKAQALGETDSILRSLGAELDRQLREFLPFEVTVRVKLPVASFHAAERFFSS